MFDDSRRISVYLVFCPIRRELSIVAQKRIILEFGHKGTGIDMPKSRGFTLIEMMITIVIVGILISLALPSFAQLIASQRLKTASFDLQAALILARGEALKRKTTVSVDKTLSSGAWGDGWRVVSSGQTLRDYTAIRGVQIAPVVSATSSVSFSRDGRVSAGTVTLLLSLPDYPSVQGRCVMINFSGMVSSKIDTDGNISNGC